MLCIGVDEDTDGAVGRKQQQSQCKKNEGEGSFSGFKPAAQAESVRPTPEPVQETPKERTTNMGRNCTSSVRRSTKEKHRKKKKPRNLKPLTGMRKRG